MKRKTYRAVYIIYLMLVGPLTLALMTISSFIENICIAIGTLCTGKLVEINITEAIYDYIAQVTWYLFDKSKIIDNKQFING